MMRRLFFALTTVSVAVSGAANAGSFVLTDQSRTFAIGDVGNSFSFTDRSLTDTPSSYTATYYYDSFPDQRGCDSSAPLGSPNACPTAFGGGLGTADFTATQQTMVRTLLSGSANGGVNGFVRFDPRTGAPVQISIAGLDLPEPATWAMLVCGFGLAGVALRRRQGTPGRKSLA